MAGRIKVIKVIREAGAFAENKDVAKTLRETSVLPALAEGRAVQLDFDRVTSATQSFIHALISEAMRRFGADVLDKIEFKSCNETIQQVIRIVTDYMQQSDAA